MYLKPGARGLVAAAALRTAHWPVLWPPTSAFGPTVEVGKKTFYVTY